MTPLSPIAGMTDAVSNSVDPTGALVEELPFMNSSDRTSFLDLIRRMLENTDSPTQPFVLRLASSNNRPVVLEMTATTMLSDLTVLVTGQVIDPNLSSLIARGGHGDGDSTSVSSITMSQIGSSLHQESPTELNDRRRAGKPDSSSQSLDESPNDTSSPDELLGESQREISGSSQEMLGESPNTSSPDESLGESQRETSALSRESLGESPTDTPSPGESPGGSQRETSGSSRETLGESPTESNGPLARETEAVQSEKTSGLPSGERQERLIPRNAFTAGGVPTQNSQYITTAAVQDAAEPEPGRSPDAGFEPEPGPGPFAFAEPLENHSVGREVESAISSLTLPTFTVASSADEASGDARMMQEQGEFF